MPQVPRLRIRRAGATPGSKSRTLRKTRQPDPRTDQASFDPVFIR